MHNYYVLIMCFLLHRSGTEEEYSELHKLFEDLVTYQRDSDMKKAEEKEAEESKKLNEKRKGESMRKAAMERLSSTYNYERC